MDCSAAVEWFPEEAQAWQLPEPVTVSQWADQHRVLSARNTAYPGPWRTRLVPFAREIMDSFGHRLVEEITVMASTQISKSEAGILNPIGYVVDQDPGPVLVVLPTGSVCRTFSDERLRTMLEASPTLAGHLTGDRDDLKKMELHLDRLTIALAGAGSVADLAQRPVRFLFLDEVDKFPAFAGREASPIELARERTRTYQSAGISKVVKTCSPTRADGYIAQEYQRSTRERYWVACPHCEYWQVLAFDCIAWPEQVDDPAQIVAEDLASYYCPHCGEAIEDRHKPAMLEGGRWVSDRYQTIDPATGEVRGQLQPQHRGFWLNCLYSPFLDWSTIAAKRVGARTTQARMNFKNSWLAEVWEDVAVASSEDALAALKADTEPDLVPAGHVALVAGVDMQKDHFRYCVYSFRLDLQSHLVAYGVVGSFRELREFIFESEWPREDGKPALKVWRAGLDTGGSKVSDEARGKTYQAYEFIRRHGRGVIWATKGMSRNTTGAMLRHSVLDKMPGKGGAKIKGGLELTLLDTDQLKHLVHERLDPESPQRIHLHRDTGPDFSRQILAEEYQRDPKTQRGSWVQVAADNHYLDCTTMAHALADPQCKGGVRRAFGRKRPRLKKPASPAPRRPAGRRRGNFVGGYA